MRRGSAEELGPICEYGEEEAIGDAVVEEGSDARPGEGQAFDQSKDSLG